MSLSLVVGPCALEYTKAKTANHFWTDPSADELVQRHRIHSGHCRQDSPTKRPALVSTAAFLLQHMDCKCRICSLQINPLLHSMCTCLSRSRKGSQVVVWMTGPPCRLGTMWNLSIRTPEPHYCLARTTF